MSKFVIEPKFWELFPDAAIGVVIAKGIDNTEVGNEDVHPDLIEMLEQANEEAKKHLTAEVFSENPVIQVWRKAFQKFKTKKGVRCSIEALLKRVEKGNEVGTINPLVDIYNTISLRYGLPCGGEDIDTFEGNLRLTVTEGGDNFLALGDEEYDVTLPGEVCYLDDEGAVCRCWNWRDGQRTMLTEDTVNAILVIESVDPSRRDVLSEAIVTLSGLIPKFLDGETEAVILTKDYPEIEL
ncbi:MAG: B3/4 domain-containing protein [Firmicutes bacterium]|nr:B3/4 domain-containing protein [Bacillota bacterium]